MTIVGAIIKADAVQDLSIWPLNERLFDVAKPCTALRKMKIESSGSAAAAVVRHLPTLAPNLEQITVSAWPFSAPMQMRHPTVQRVKLAATCLRPFRSESHSHTLQNLPAVAHANGEQVRPSLVPATTY